MFQKFLSLLFALILMMHSVAAPINTQDVILQGKTTIAIDAFQRLLEQGYTHHQITDLIMQSMQTDQLDVIDLGVQSRKIKGRDKNLCFLVGVGIGCAAVVIFASGIYAYVFYKDKQEAMDLLQGRYDLLLMQLNEFNESKSQLDQVKRQIDKQKELEAAVIELNEESNNLSQQCLLDEQIRDLEEQRKLAEEKNEALRRRREELSEQYDKEFLEENRLKENYRNAEEQLKLVEEATLKAEREIAQFNAEINRLKQECEQNILKKNQLDKELHLLPDQITSAQELKNKATAELELIQKKHDELLQVKDALQNEANTESAKISELKDEISRLQAECKNFKKAIDSRQSAEQALEAQLKYDKDELELLIPYQKKINDLKNKSTELYQSMIDITNKYRKKSEPDFVNIEVNNSAQGKIKFKGGHNGTTCYKDLEYDQNVAGIMTSLAIEHERIVESAKSVADNINAVKKCRKELYEQEELLRLNKAKNKKSLLKIIEEKTIALENAKKELDKAASTAESELQSNDAE
jgi:hypothetical protein